jgi:hypothetical protein
MINSIVNERLQSKFEQEEFYETVQTEESIISKVKDKNKGKINKKNK